MCGSADIGRIVTDVTCGWPAIGKLVRAPRQPGYRDTGTTLHRVGSGQRGIGNSSARQFGPGYGPRLCCCLIWAEARTSSRRRALLLKPHSLPAAKMIGRSSFIIWAKISNDTCCFPSLHALEGSGCTSISNASAPIATAPLHIAFTKSARPAP